MSTLKKNIDVVFTGGKSFTPAVFKVVVTEVRVPVIPQNTTGSGVSSTTLRWRFIPGLTSQFTSEGYGNNNGFFVPYYE